MSDDRSSETLSSKPLATQLREWFKDADPDSIGVQLALIAADEIERLRLQVYALTNANKSLADGPPSEPGGCAHRALPEPGTPARRLRDWISDRLQGGCKMLSQGDACTCALCDFDRLRAPQPPSDAPLLKRARNLLIDCKSFIGPTTVWRDADLMLRNVQQFIDDTRDAVTKSPHQHTDECWEPDSGCDIGRSAKHAKLSDETNGDLLSDLIETLEAAKNCDTRTCKCRSKRRQMQAIDNVVTCLDCGLPAR